jgi:hypothetical protein
MASVRRVRRTRERDGTYWSAQEAVFGRSYVLNRDAPASDGATKGRRTVQGGHGDEPAENVLEA